MKAARELKGDPARSSGCAAAEGEGSDLGASRSQPSLPAAARAVAFAGTVKRQVKDLRGKGNAEVAEDDLIEQLRSMF